MRELVRRLRNYWKWKSGYFISSRARVYDRKNVKLGNRAEIAEFVIVRSPKSIVSIGNYSQVNPFTVIYGGEDVLIGENVMIGPHCMISAGNHDFKQLNVPMRFAGNVSKGPIIIGKDTWIGAGCVITDGVEIGENVVVAAGSVVTKNLPEYSIAAGVPAKVIGSRKS